MPTVTLREGTSDEVVLAYEELGASDADAVLLIAGCGQPAFAWLVGVGPALAAAGYRVIMFDNRGVAPSSSPPAPYTVEVMTDDALGLLDHLEIPIARIAGHSMGGWIAETLVARHPDACTPPPFSAVATRRLPGRRRSRRSSAISRDSTTNSRRSSTRPRRCAISRTRICRTTQPSTPG